MEEMSIMQQICNKFQCNHRPPSNNSRQSQNEFYNLLIQTVEMYWNWEPVKNKNYFSFGFSHWSIKIQNHLHPPHRQQPKMLRINQMLRNFLKKLPRLRFHHRNHKTDVRLSHTLAHQRIVSTIQNNKHLQSKKVFSILSNLAPNQSSLLWWLIK